MHILVRHPGVGALGAALVGAYLARMYRGNCSLAERVRRATVITSVPRQGSRLDSLFAKVRKA